jgi:hypothetical protein
MMDKKNWQKEIKAFEAGHTIQEYTVFFKNNVPFGWTDNPNPDWNPLKQFRIKPTSQPVKALEQFNKRLARRTLLWNCAWMSVTVAIVVQLQLVVARHFPDDWVVHFGALFTALGLTLTVVREVEALLDRSWLKGYLIEDHGNVLKLYGGVRLIDMPAAYSDLLSRKPNFMIADDAYKRFGCTLAVVRC